MYFSPSRGAPSLNSLTIQIDNAPIEQVRHYKYLGYEIDDCLSLNKTASNTFSKLNGVLYIFRGIRSSLCLKASIAVLKAKFIPYIDYILLFSYLFSKKDFKKLQVLQNNCIRIAFGLSKRTNVDGLHCKLGLLHVEHRRYLLLMSYMYRQAAYLPHITQANDMVSTRASHKRNFKVMRPVHTKYEKSHLHQGHLLWNELSLEYQNMPDLSWFKRRLKNHLLEVEKSSYLP